jgi:uncharacterized membrane protein YdjX (TVP38/TMEM64 family)
MLMDNHKTLLRSLLVVALLGGIATAVIWREHLSTDSIEAWIGQLGWIAPLVFITAYALATVLFAPGLLFTLAGGALFGPLLGTVYNLTGATIGATLAFLTARYLASDWVGQKAGKRLRPLVDGVAEEGWRFVAFVRLVPLIPFNLLNYALGLTQIRLSHYIIASFIFMAPGGAAYTYLGYAGREIAAGGEDVIKKVLLALALVATIVFVSRLVLRHRKRTRQAGDMP